MSSPRLLFAVVLALTASACKQEDAAAKARLVSLPLEMTAGSATAAVTQSDAGIESCAKAALARVPGDLLQATLNSETTGRIWAFEIRQADGRRVGLECSDSAGTVVEADRLAASASDPAFASIATVDEKTARAHAVDTKPGRIERVAYKLGRAQQAIYAIDVLTDDGTIRIDIDAASGELIRTSRELLRIGSLPVTRSAR